MAVRKYNLNEEHYKLVKAFLKEIGFPAPHLTHEQMIRLHELSTMVGVPSSPGSCPTCNRRAYTALTGYVFQYEGLEEE